MSRLRRVPWWALVGAVAVGAVVVIGIGLYHDYYSGDPSADDVAVAIRSAAPDACYGHVVVRSVNNIGGPGLPSGMQRANDLVCDGTHIRMPPLASQYVFSSNGDAKSWLARNQFVLGDHRYGWLLHDRTLVGSSFLSESGVWRSVLRRLETSQ